ncbi:hypothetical protein [Legionella londiniensis]|uniref:Uncharacterized protein n=1 Tax=Legionella londiniensis TaxID=45068 RepID=A0A0W0VNG0_9GAMM|nr:hypothetical protein [Legionella londiniensis]KTD21610.1 hypothetical protein Llon_0775 [Legionella londiniensis]STX93381.1 Uncharacterised protein [Legionella londiniensis]
MFSVIDKKRLNYYCCEIKRLENEFDLYIQSKSASEVHSFPYSALHDIIEKIKNFNDTEEKIKLLENIKVNILSRLMQHNPKIYPLFLKVEEMTIEMQEKESDISLLTRNSIA